MRRTILSLEQALTLPYATQRRNDNPDLEAVSKYFI